MSGPARETGRALDPESGGRAPVWDYGPVPAPVKPQLLPGAVFQSHVPTTDRGSGGRAWGSPHVDNNLRNVGWGHLEGETGWASSNRSGQPVEANVALCATAEWTRGSDKDRGPSLSPLPPGLCSHDDHRSSGWGCGRRGGLCEIRAQRLPREQWTRVLFCHFFGGR